MTFILDVYDLIHPQALPQNKFEQVQVRRSWCSYPLFPSGD